MGRRDRNFQHAVEKWVADDYGVFARLRMFAGGVVHNRLPRTFRPAPTLHWVTRNGLASSAPVVALYYGTIGWTTAYIAAGGLFLANAAVGVIGAIAGRTRGEGSDADEALVRFGDLLSALRQGPVPKAKRGDAIKACLGLIEVQARRIAKVRKGALSVSLVEYIGNSTTRMTIRHRNPGNDRPVGREFDGSQLLGHHACVADASPRVVHNLRHFGKNLKSPTQSKVNYRSMLFIPIKPNGDGARIKGFVSIDCQREYAFYGSRADSIVVTCTPVVELLRDLIGETH